MFSAAGLAAAATGSVLTAANLGVWRPSGERRRRGRQFDIYDFARSQVYGSGGTKLRSIGEVDFDPDLVQDVVGRVLHGANEGVACSVVVHYQPGASSNHVEGLIQDQGIGAIALFAGGRAGCAAATAFGSFSTAFAAGAVVFTTALGTGGCAAMLAAGLLVRA